MEISSNFKLTIDGQFGNSDDTPNFISYPEIYLLSNTFYVFMSFLREFVELEEFQ